ncbi:hypothetical protein IHE33_15740 (plasmid) [Mycetohabitans endofungorum]|uniref:hypothetical protein n=1 Tax=Mycetohabitans endofungorum TaxID=417203 RepID=UPI0030D06B32
MISSYPYAQPVLNRPKDLELVKNAGAAHGVASGVGIGIRGLEIVQTIQSVDNQVRLIAGKATVARLYLDPTTIASNALVTGELAWRRDGGGMAYLPAINRVRLTPTTRPSLQEQRFDAALSLNFVLPSEAVEAGRLELTIQRIYVPGANDVPIATPVQLSVEFRRAPLLRVRAIGLRYKSLSRPGSFATPNATHFNFLKSYLLRAYPDLPDFFGPFQSWRTASIASVEQYRCLNSLGVR